MDESSDSPHFPIKHPHKYAFVLAGAFMFVTSPGWKGTFIKMLDALFHPSFDSFLFFISARPFLVFWLIYFAVLSLFLSQKK